MDFTPIDHEQEILDRAKQLSGGLAENRLRLALDLAVVNEIIPLDGEKLLHFPDFDFWHDIAGITRHLDRDRGVLTDFFVPRCAKLH